MCLGWSEAICMLKNQLAKQNRKALNSQCSFPSLGLLIRPCFTIQPIFLLREGNLFPILIFPFSSSEIHQEFQHH